MSDFQCKFYLLDGAETLECKDDNAEYVIIITTGRAGGLHRPPWGLLPAEPIGSSNLLSTA